MRRAHLFVAFTLLNLIRAFPIGERECKQKRITLRKHVIKTCTTATMLIKTPIKILIKIFSLHTCGECVMLWNGNEVYAFKTSRIHINVEWTENTVEMKWMDKYWFYYPNACPSIIFIFNDARFNVRQNYPFKIVWHKCFFAILVNHTLCAVDQTVLVKLFEWKIATDNNNEMGF